MKVGVLCTLLEAGGIEPQIVKSKVIGTLRLLKQNSKNLIDESPLIVENKWAFSLSMMSYLSAYLASHLRMESLGTFSVSHLTTKPLPGMVQIQSVNFISEAKQ